MSIDYIPGKGDIVRLEIGSEEPGETEKQKRSMLVISPKAYNEKTGLALFCPVKNKTRNYPFEVVIPEDSKAKGIILTDQVKSLNWKNRNAEFLCKLQEEKFNDVISKLSTLI
jgi:mRNA interferase MazF